MQYKGSRIVKTLKMNKIEEPNFQTSYKATLLKTAWYCYNKQM